MSKRTYDHRVRNAIARTGNPSLFPELNIPRTTAQQWIREGEKEVVTTHQFTKTDLELVVLSKALIEDACERANASSRHSLPNVLVDSGTENLNRHVDALVKSGLIKRTIAQIDISFSNSMIESSNSKFSGYFECFGEQRK